MRWNKKVEPKVGDERKVYRFLLFPTCLNGEYRWLEHTCIIQEYNSYCEWINKKWGTYTQKEIEELEKQGLYIE